MNHLAAPPSLRRSEPPIYKRVLYAEDDECVRISTSSLLTHLGCDVTSEPHGGAALDRYRAGNFDVVITDHDMPGTDGLVLVQSLRARGFDGRIYVVTGGVSATASARYRELNVDGIVAKPVALAKLRAMLGAA